MSCVLLLSHRDDISSFSSRFSPPCLFLPRAHTFLIVVFKLQRQSLLYPAITGPFIARAERIIPRRFTIVQRPRSDAPLLRARRVNFLQIGILLQFASSSIILASSRDLPLRPRSRSSGFCSRRPYFLPPHFSRALCWLRVFAVYPGPFKVSIRDKHRFRVKSKVTSNWNFLTNRSAFVDVHSYYRNLSNFEF